MCKEGRCWIRMGGTVWNTLKGGGTEKRGGETKGQKVGQGVGALKSWGGGLEPPYELWIY